MKSLKVILNVLPVIFFFGCGAIVSTLEEERATQRPDHVASEKYEGLWLGFGELFPAASRATCVGGYRVAFYVKNGKAVSLLGTYKFTSPISQGGSIKFRYENAGFWSSDSHPGGRRKVPVDFRGKLDNGVAKGSITLRQCVGQWKATRQSTVKINDAELAIHKNLLLVLSDGQLKNTIRPFKGYIFSTVKSVGDFFVIYVDASGGKKATLVYHLVDSDNYDKISVIRGHHIDVEREHRNFDYQIADSQITVLVDGVQRSIISTPFEKSSTALESLGDLLLINEDGKTGVRSTLLYYMKESGKYRQIAKIRDHLHLIKK